MSLSHELCGSATGELRLSDSCVAERFGQRIRDISVVPFYLYTTDNERYHRGEDPAPQRYDLSGSFGYLDRGANDEVHVGPVLLGKDPAFDNKVAAIMTGDPDAQWEEVYSGGFGLHDRESPAVAAIGRALCQRFRECRGKIKGTVEGGPEFECGAGGPAGLHQVVEKVEI